MALDQTSNFVRGAVDASINSGDTTISVVDASLYPDPANGEYNLVLWDAGSYPRPDQDPDVEVVRVTGRDTTNDNLTVTRAQESTSDVSHPATSQLALTPTAKMFSDIDSQKLGDGEDFDGQGTSSFSNVQSVATDELSGGVLGGVTVSNLAGTNLSVDGDGNLNASGGGGSEPTLSSFTVS